MFSASFGVRGSPIVSRFSVANENAWLQHLAATSIECYPKKTQFEKVCLRKRK